MKLTRYWVAPVVFGVMVLFLGLALLVIGARSPYTHSNREAGPDPSYSRTQQTLVGTPVAYTPPGAANPSAAPKDQVTLGAQLFVEENCASCHGLNGTGGTFAPNVRGFNPTQLREKTSAGPGGMPVFSNLSDAQLQAIAAFLAGPAPAPAAAAAR
jgi:mono/diheme cytochrome c family protein